MLGEIIKGVIGLLVGGMESAAVNANPQNYEIIQKYKKYENCDINDMLSKYREKYGEEKFMYVIEKVENMPNMKLYDELARKRGELVDIVIIKEIKRRGLPPILRNM